MSSNSRLLLRPFSGAIVWAGGGAASGFCLPQVLSMVGLTVHSPTLVTTTCLVGSVAVLMPTGFARGVLRSVEEVVETHGKPAIRKAFDETLSGGGTSKNSSLLTKDGDFLLLEQMTLGSGWQGRVLRTLASPFLPSTAQMMVRTQQAMEEIKEARQQNADRDVSSDGHVAAAAVGGFLEGFLQDKKDTVTTIGSAVYAVLVLLGLGVDYVYRRADEKRLDWKEQQQERMDKKEELQKQRQESVQGSLQRVKEMFGFPAKKPSEGADEEREKRKK